MVVFATALPHTKSGLLRCKPYCFAIHWAMECILIALREGKSRQGNKKIRVDKPYIAKQGNSKLSIT
jgi:hypothetical protein